MMTGVAERRRNCVRSFETVHAGKHDIQKNQIEAAFYRAGQARWAIVRRLNDIARSREELRNELAQTHIVVDNQNPMRPLDRPFPRRLPFYRITAAEVAIGCGN